jgi:type VI protein secretion system component Hcp
MSQLKFGPWAALSVCLLSVTSTAVQAAQSAFLQVPGIPGESVTRGYENWIELSGFGQEFSRRACGGMTLNKTLDRASALLAVAAVNGEVLAQATVAVRNAGEGGAEILRLVLSDVTVQSSTIKDVASTNAVEETLQLQPRVINITYRSVDDAGRLGPPITTVVTCNRPSGR